MAYLNKEKCESCGAPMRYDPERELLVCDYCGATKNPRIPDPETEPENVELLTETEFSGFDFNSLNDQAVDTDAENIPVYICESCGAEVLAAAENFSLNCPYCGNNIVLSDKISGRLRPDGVIPFAITSKELPSAVNRFYKDKPLLPKRFFSENTIGKVTGVYVPFWVFSGIMSGTLEFHGQKELTMRRGDYIDTETKHYRLTRNVSMKFENLPIDASEKVDDAMADSLEPYDMSAAKPFDTAYLAGFTADRFDVAKSDIAARAEERMKNTAEDICRSAVGSEYSMIEQTGGRLDADIDAKYLLFPVYMFNIRYGGKNYPFAVNGQTGKVVGNLPNDNKTKMLYFLKRAAIVLGVVLAISIISYFLGR